MNKELPKFIKEFQQRPLDARLKDAHKIKVKYNNERIPIIVDAIETDFKINKNKYLVPINLKMSEFMYILRRHINILEEECIFILCNNKLVNMLSTMYELYSQEKDNDNFLYLVITKENAFG